MFRVPHALLVVPRAEEGTPCHVWCCALGYKSCQLLWQIVAYAALIGCGRGGREWARHRADRQWRWQQQQQGMLVRQLDSHRECNLAAVWQAALQGQVLLLLQWHTLCCVWHKPGGAAVCSHCRQKATQLLCQNE